MVIMIILLILCLPLILMLSLFTATNVVSIAVDLPVSSIDVLVEEMVELDLDKGESFTVDYVIYPTEAKNKNVSYEFSAIGDAERADFRIEGNTLIPISAGQARVTVTTSDGGHRDSFDIIVRSRAVEKITSSPVDSVISVGQTTKIETSFLPATANNKSLSYRVVEGENIATVDSTGTIRGIGIGTAKIEVTSLSNPNAKSVFEITVEVSEVISFANDRSSLTSLQDDRDGEFLVVLNPYVTFEGDPIIEVFDERGNPVSNSVISAVFDGLNGKLKYEMLDRTYIGTLELRMTVTPVGEDPVSKSCYVTQVSEISADWESEETEYGLDSNGMDLIINLNPSCADVTFSVILQYNKTGEGIAEGNINPGEKIVLETGVEYEADGGYISIEISNSEESTVLSVRRKIEPSSSELANATVSVTLTVKDNNDPNSSEIILETVVIYVI